MSQAISPYLLLHAHNPVDWYQWGPDALARARQQDRPIFLSIGYSACHWCHVMARESFENPAVAEVLNQYFVSIKVDREERPDLDDLYMQAALVLNQGQAGWPLSVWLTPDCKPFFAGTYFPPTARAGRPGLTEVCRAIAQAWRERRADIAAQADRLTDVVRNSLQPPPAADEPLSLSLVDETAEMLAAAFDPISGGLVSGKTNKFPPSLALELLLRSAVRRAPGSARRKQLLDLVQLTLDNMAAGGIYDQLGGGIHRYSTDVEWHVPHFEKMLYDQALVSRIYLDAWLVTGKPLYADVGREILEYVLADLRCGEGAFCSSRDADSEGVEGKYYVWTRAEVLEILGEDCGAKFAACFDISANGNWQDPRDPQAHKSVPRRLRDPEVCARMYGIATEEFNERMAHVREKLLAARSRRVPPARDEKILCEWNGLMIASLARGGCVLGEPRFIAAAEEAARFLLDKQYRDGRLLRSYRQGQALGTAFLSDYACLIEGLIELYEATFDQRWLEKAVELNCATVQRFWDQRHGAFFFTAHDHEPLIARSKCVHDGVLPSGNSVQLSNLLRLSVMLGDEQLRALADSTMAALAGQVQASPWSAERFLAAVEFATAGPVVIGLVGNPSLPDTQALLRQVHTTWLPNRVLMLSDPTQPQAAVRSPLLQDRGMVDGRPTAWVCGRQHCAPPATTPQDLARQLAAVAMPG